MQTETPEQLAKRNAELKAAGQKQAGVVRREKVAVLSRGTLIDAEMVHSRPDASYIMAGGSRCKLGDGKGEGGRVERIYGHPTDGHPLFLVLMLFAVIKWLLNCLWYTEAVTTESLNTDVPPPLVGYDPIVCAVCEEVLPLAAAASQPSSGPPPPVVLVGICAVDVASGHVLVGQFHDDEVWGGVGRSLTGKFGDMWGGNGECNRS